MGVGEKAILKNRHYEDAYNLLCTQEKERHSHSPVLEGPKIMKSKVPHNDKHSFRHYDMRTHSNSGECGTHTITSYP